jgi:hypothetical protein
MSRVGGGLTDISRVCLLIFCKIFQLVAPPHFFQMRAAMGFGVRGGGCEQQGVGGSACSAVKLLLVCLLQYGTLRYLHMTFILTKNLNTMEIRNEKDLKKLKKLFDRGLFIPSLFLFQSPHQPIPYPTPAQLNVHDSRLVERVQAPDKKDVTFSSAFKQAAHILMSPCNSAVIYIQSAP